MSKIIAKEIATEIINILKEEKVINNKEMSTFQKTERLLYEYDMLKTVVKNKKIRIEDLKNGKFQLEKVYPDVKVNVQSSKTYLSELEKIENKIENLEKEIIKIQNVVDLIENGLESIKNEKYYNILELKYFNKNTIEEISECTGLSVATIKRNKNDLVNKLKFMIFFTEALNFL